MPSLYKESVKSGQRAVEQDGRWLFGEYAIVADNDDPERQHRVRVIIPSIDENYIFDEWARQLVFCLGGGFGSVFIPPKGSEVVIFGCLGQKYNLFFASLYNEEMLIPSEFTDIKDTGFHAPKDLKLIAEKTTKVKGENVNVEAAQAIKLDGGKLTVNIDGSITITGGNITIDGANVTILGRTVLKNGQPI